MWCAYYVDTENKDRSVPHIKSRFHGEAMPLLKHQQECRAFALKKRREIHRKLRLMDVAPKDREASRRVALDLPTHEAAAVCGKELLPLKDVRD